ncbi:hypothetical protein [Carboxylicivirga linearis]|uniref:Uncharacterized protein n=1 Tax=Carboxylicivirga linearis TaxID=1628157 RepID=A0ABS5JWK6_9BACT|nr:hypothetical protein [Carboxylicivirga linearis]MBS2099302.1 hypothetical protein [Carboxylicivirga linearis]
MNNELNKQQTNLPDLISLLRYEDERNKKSTNRFKIFYFVFGAVYAFVFILHFLFDEDNAWTDSLSGIFYVLAWITFALLFRKANKEYSQIDYSLPTILMLRKAAQRYKLFQPKLRIAIGAVILINIASSLNKVVIPMTQSAISDIIQFQIIFAIAISVGFIIGVLVWRKRQKPIRDNILALIDELENY